MVYVNIAPSSNRSTGEANISVSLAPLKAVLDPFTLFLDSCCLLLLTIGALIRPLLQSRKLSAALLTHLLSRHGNCRFFFRSVIIAREAVGGDLIQKLQNRKQKTLPNQA